MAGLGGFKRLFHWGPLIAIGIIKCITFVSLYMNAMWWPANQSFGGFLHQTVFLAISAITSFNFLMSSFNGPGYLPLKWEPKTAEAKSFLQFCTICEGYKAPRSHHCRKCDRCVMKMDHHCPWINNCVGWGNHMSFTCFLAFAVLGCLQASVILGVSLYRGIHRQWYLYYGDPQLATVHFTLTSLILCIFSLGLAIGVVIAVGMLLYFQACAIIRNRTGIEEWIIEKAKYRREESNEHFVYPYDLGTKQNILQVARWNCEAVGDGINWVVTDGCDQFTLTREQISQKGEKRARTRTYTIIKSVSGSWMPLWSQGFKVTCSPPCTDEPRIKLQVNDTVLVTRWRKHWLFGEKHDENSNEKAKLRLRGWFPRQCAAVMYVENGHEDHNTDDEHSTPNNHTNLVNSNLNDKKKK